MYTRNAHGAVLVGETIVGYVSHGSGCENPACIEANERGRCWHAIPRSLPGGPYPTLPRYHYGSEAAAVVAVGRAFRRSVETI